VIGLNDVIEYLVYERIVKLNPQSKETQNFLGSLDPKFTLWMKTGFNVKWSNLFDFRDL
jgi:hypothetical protein